jgi:hypothetical protein
MILLVFWGGGSGEYEFSVSENKLISPTKRICECCGNEIPSQEFSGWRAENLDHASLVFSFLWGDKKREIEDLRLRG